MTLDLFDIEYRNQVLLERLKVSLSDKFVPVLTDIERQVSRILRESGEVIETKKQLKQVLRDIDKFLVEKYGIYNADLLEDLEELAEQQAEFELEAMKEVADFDEVAPNPDRVRRSIYLNPMSIENYSGVLLLEPFIRNLTQSQINIIENRITNGWARGQTVQEIVRSLRGTRAQNFRDGTMAQVDRSNQAIVHTTVQHASSQARQETWEANSDILDGYEWLSTLDNKTSQICRTLDGKVFKVGLGPMPPIHIRCRSTTLPAISDEYLVLDIDETRPSIGPLGNVRQVPADLTYYEWLKRQPKSFQETAIGKARAKLLRDGGLTAEEFGKLQLNRNFKPLTLEEMRRLRPQAFERAGL